MLSYLTHLSCTTPSSFEIFRKQNLESEAYYGDRVTSPMSAVKDQSVISSNYYGQNEISNEEYDCII